MGRDKQKERACTVRWRANRREGAKGEKKMDEALGEKEIEGV